MAAILYPYPLAAELPDPHVDVESRPRFSLLQGDGDGAPVSAPARTSAQKRLVAIALAVSAVVGLWSLATTPAAHVASAPSSGVHVVTAGESLWSIAGQLDVHGDRRDVVDRLADMNGGYDVTVHQELEIPSDLTLSGR